MRRSSPSRAGRWRYPVAAAVLLAWAFSGLAAQDGPAVVALLLDSSGSLRREDLSLAQSLALAVLRELPPGSEMMVFRFDDRPQLLLGRTADVARIERAIAEVAISGRRTALYEALFDAGNHLRREPLRRQAVLLLTDGRDEDSAVTVDDSLEALREGGVPVFAVGVGKVEAPVLRRIARLTGGQYVSAGEAAAGPLAAALQQAIRANLAALPPPAAGETQPIDSAMPATASRIPAGDAAQLLLACALLAVGFGATAAALWLHRRPREQPAAPVPAAPAGAPAPVPPRPPVAPTVLTSRLRDGTRLLDGGEKFLKVREGQDAGQLHRLDPLRPTLVGRGPHADVQILDLAVSAEHCRLLPGRGELLLRDLGSTNGTYVNGERVTERALVEGDVLRIGDTYLELRGQL